MRTLALLTLTAPIILTAACKPPPTDADMLRDMPETAPTFASDPLPSPNTEGAGWSPSTRSQYRILYGVPGEDALLELDCVPAPTPTIRIKRTSPADEGAGALLALVGNGHIGRIKVDATRSDGRFMWQGEAPAEGDVWEPLTGRRELIATVPGAGTVAINPSSVPGLMIRACRTGTMVSAKALIQQYENEERATELSPLP